MALPILLGTGRLTPAAAALARLTLTGVTSEIPSALGSQTIPVSSSAIREIGWRSDNIITVTFNRGGTYTYDGTYDLFLAFASAPSKGTFFNQNFRR